MKRLFSFIIVLTLLFQCSCNKAPTENTGTEATEINAPVQEPVYVYEDAVEDFLGTVDDYSWERLYAPEYVMIHFISAVSEHPDDPYNMEYIRNIFIDYDISIHYIVERDGTIRCYIPENRVAWHAGAGEFNNDPKYSNQMNQYAIGIEVIAIGSENDMSIYMDSDTYNNIDPSLIGFTEEQYSSLQLLVNDICERNSIPFDKEHIIGHEDYSSDKTDPGELFDWDRLLNQQ